MSKFDLLRSKIEQDLQKLAQQTQTLYNQRCKLQYIACINKSYLNCQGTDYRNECFPDYPKQNQCVYEGVKFSSSSGVRFPNDVDIDDLDNDIKSFVCASTNLDSVYKEIQRTYLDKVRRTYIGLSYGFFRDYPATMLSNNDGTCLQNYHPKNRIWYVQATTGSKNIVFVIDLSHNVNNQMLKQIKQSVLLTIDTFGVNDFFGVVIMSQNSEILLYQELTRAKQQYKRAIKNSISSIQVNATQVNIDYQLAFNKVKQLFNKPIDPIYGQKCQHSSNIVLFLTASSPTKGASTIDGLINSINSWNDQIKLKLFAYKLGDIPNSQLLKALSCQYEGTFFKIENREMLLQNIRHYQKQLSYGISIDSAIWSQPYNDANTKERMVTASIPLYHYVDRKRYVIGAAGVDVLMKILEEENISETEAIKKLVKCTPSKSINLDPCFIQQLRPSDSKCGLSSCPNFKSKVKTCNQEIKQKIFAEAPIKDKLEYDCCSLTVTAWTILVIVFSVVGFFILIGIIFILVRLYLKHKARKKEEGKPILQQGQKEQKMQMIHNIASNDRIIPTDDDENQNKKQDRGQDKKKKKLNKSSKLDQNRKNQKQKTQQKDTKNQNQNYEQQIEIEIQSPRRPQNIVPPFTLQNYVQSSINVQVSSDSKQSKQVQNQIELKQKNKRRNNPVKYKQKSQNKFRYD